MPSRSTLDSLRLDHGLLRALRPGDGPALADALGAAGDRIGGFTDWATEIHTALEHACLAEVCRQDFDAGTAFVFGMFAADQLYGVCGFWPEGYPAASRTAAIGGWIRTDRAGRGIAAHTGRAFVSWGLSVWPWLRLEARCSVDNLRGIHLAESIGLLREARLPGVWDRYQQRHVDKLLFARNRSENTGQR